MTAEERLAAAVAELVDALRAVARAAAAPSAPERLLSIDEAARALGIGRTALYSELAAGRVRSVKIGRRRLVPASAVIEFIAERSV